MAFKLTILTRFTVFWDDLTLSSDCFTTITTDLPVSCPDLNQDSTSQLNKVSRTDDFSPVYLSVNLAHKAKLLSRNKTAVCHGV